MYFKYRMWQNSFYENPTAVANTYAAHVHEWHHTLLTRKNILGIDVTAELRQREGRPTLQLLWDSTVPEADMAVYMDAGARQDLDEERGCSLGLVIPVSDKWWGAIVPLETWVDNTTAELLGVVLGR